MAPLGTVYILSYVIKKSKAFLLQEKHKKIKQFFMFLNAKKCSMKNNYMI